MSHMAVKSFNNLTVTSASHWKDAIPLAPHGPPHKSQPTLLHPYIGHAKGFLSADNLNVIRRLLCKTQTRDYLTETVRTMCPVSLRFFSLSFSSINWTHNRQTSINQTPKHNTRDWNLRCRLRSGKMKAAKTVKSKMDYTRGVLLQIGWITDLEWLSHLSWFLFLCIQWWSSSRVEGPGIALTCLGLSWWEN